MHDFARSGIDYFSLVIDYTNPGIDNSNSESDYSNLVLAVINLEFDYTSSGIDMSNSDFKYPDKFGLYSCWGFHCFFRIDTLSRQSDASSNQV